MSDWDWSDAERLRLAAFLEERSLAYGEVSTRRIGDGHSNLTYLVSDGGGHQVVVRRPPPPPTPPGAHDMLREARLIGA
ncbi:MAG: phosphotransferase, partial [Sciscionella sp.]